MATMATHAQEQIHITYTGRPGEMAVDFVSVTRPACTVEWRAITAAAATPALGTQPALSNAGTNTTSTSVCLPHIGYQHQAVMAPLSSNTSYSYSIHCGTNSSEHRKFWSKRAYSPSPSPNATGASGVQRVLYFADFGLNNDVSMAALNNEGLHNNADFAIHGGDLAYDLPDNQSAVGSAFLNAIEPLASRVPYMVVAGNHEYVHVSLLERL